MKVAIINPDNFLSKKSKQRSKYFIVIAIDTAKSKRLGQRLIIDILASPSSASLIAIDEPEMGLHPSMLPIVAEYAVAATERTQVILTTHSPQFLNAFTETQPTITIAMCAQSETHLKNLNAQAFDYWLKELQK